MGLHTSFLKLEIFMQGLEFNSALGSMGNFGFISVEFIKEMEIIVYFNGLFNYHIVIDFEVKKEGTYNVDTDILIKNFTWIEGGDYTKTL